jgi:hypothetical protein
MQGQIVDFAMEGMLDDNKLTGTFTNASMGSVPFVATRSK